MKAEPTKLYFAYGSNLHIAQMKRRCPDAVKVGVVRLFDYQMVFKRYADVVPHRNAVTPGAVYRISRRDELALDMYEGFDPKYPRLGAYRKEHFAIRADDGKVESVMFYVMNRRSAHPPTELYYATIQAGYADWGLDRRPLEAALMASFRSKSKGAGHARETVRR